MDNGKKERLLILQRDFKSRIQKFFDIHHWISRVIEISGQNIKNFCAIHASNIPNGIFATDI